MASRGKDGMGLERARSRERTRDVFQGGKVNAGINDRGDARKGFGPTGTGKGMPAIVGTPAGYKGGKI